MIWLSKCAVNSNVGCLSSWNNYVIEPLVTLTHELTDLWLTSACSCIWPLSHFLIFSCSQRVYLWCELCQCAFSSPINLTRTFDQRHLKSSLPFSPSRTLVHGPFQIPIKHPRWIVDWPLTSWSLQMPTKVTNQFRCSGVTPCHQDPCGPLGH